MIGDGSSCLDNRDGAPIIVEWANALKTQTLFLCCQEPIDSNVLILFTVNTIGTGGEPWNFA
jgi:hypothetical protein